MTLGRGLEHPWGMAFLPDGDILVTERAGRLRRIVRGELAADAIEGLPAVAAGGQGGLLDIALHPDFEDNGWIYLTYAKARSDGQRTTALARARLEGNFLVQLEEIYEADAWTPEDRHFGSRIAFDGDGHLFITVGDRGERSEAQSLANDQGKVLRLEDDGGIPPGNPFADAEGASPAIWALGIRNAQGLFYDRAGGELWVAEHGPRGGDELNRVERGRNYGWPEITFGLDYDGSVISELTEKEGMEQPLEHWSPSPAFSGTTIYDGAAFPAWTGDLLIGGLAGREVLRLTVDAGDVVEREWLLRGLGKRIRDVRSGPDGFVYLLLDEASAALLRLEPIE